MKKQQFLWETLPVFATIYIRPHVLNLETLEDKIDYIHHLLEEHDNTNNPNKKLCYNVVSSYLYEQVTGLPWNNPLKK